MTQSPTFTRGAERARPRRSVTPKVTATRRGSHAPIVATEPAGRAAATTGRVRVSPNAIMASRGAVDLSGVKSLARLIARGARTVRQEEFRTASAKRPRSRPNVAGVLRLTQSQRSSRPRG
jgi:hypothetical protein